MKMIQKLILFFLSIIFFIFEDIIWNQIVVRVIDKIKEWNIYKVYMEWLQAQDKYMILINFLILFGLSEVLGLQAFVYFAKLQLIMGVALYGLKIIFTIVAFAILNTSKEILFSFWWFKWSYEKITNFIDTIKNSVMYMTLKTLITDLKTKILPLILETREVFKNMWASLKNI